jgi:hypothetical protein
MSCWERFEIDKVLPWGPPRRFGTGMAAVVAALLLGKVERRNEAMKQILRWSKMNDEANPQSHCTKDLHQCEDAGR